MCQRVIVWAVIRFRAVNLPPFRLSPVDRRSGFVHQSPDKPIYISSSLDDGGRFTVVYPQGGMK
jgi:hypothetical protein